MSSDPQVPRVGAAMHALIDRYAGWLRMGGDEVLVDRAEDPTAVRAIQILVHMPKSSPPAWHAALGLSAAGCAALCLDSRAEPGGEWFEAVERYCDGHIRKVTRRGRGAQWEATATLPGLTVAHGETTVRILVPGLVTEVDKSVAKLQVGGTDFPTLDEPSVVCALPEAEVEHPADASGDRSPDDAMVPLLTVYVPGEDVVHMTAGKLMAQTGHAGMLGAALLADHDAQAALAWRDAGCPTLVQRTDVADWAPLMACVADPLTAWSEYRLIAVRDAGFTEIDPGTVTAVAHLIQAAHVDHRD